MHLLLDRYVAPVAELLIVTDEDGALRTLEFADHKARMNRMLRDHYENFELHEEAAPPAILRALDAYFAGDLVRSMISKLRPGARRFNARYGRPLERFPPASRKVMGNLPPRLAARGRAAPLALRMAPIQSRLLCPATVSSGQMEPSQAMAAGCHASAGYSITNVNIL